MTLASSHRATDKSFQGGQGLFRMFTWGFTPGYYMAGFQPSEQRRIVAGRVAGGGGRAETLASRDRHRIGCLAPRHPRLRLQRRDLKARRRAE